MELELVPLDEKATRKKLKKKQSKKRYRIIRPKELRRFTKSQQDKIKDFLIELVLIVHDIQHETERGEGTKGHEERLAHLNERRFALFENPKATVTRFIKLLRLAPVEAGEEIEVLIRELRGEDLQDHYRTEIAAGIDVARDNPFLRQMDDNIEDEKVSLAMQTRLTNTEIEALIRHRSLQDIVDNLINARRVISGLFWQDSYYDL